MQLFLDTTVESPAALRLAAEFLNSHAALREAMESTDEVPTGTMPAAPVVPPAPPSFPSAPSLPAAPIAVATPNIPVSVPTGNVVPFVPPAPTTIAPSAATPATTAATATPNLAPVSPAASAVPPAPVADEFDAHGVPYDARIHQSGKSQKKDGSWKLKKGIDDAIVSVVMQELAPRIRKPVPASAPTHAVPAGASPAPVSLPPVPPPPGAEVPPPPPAVPVPPAPQAHVETVAPAADPFRALVAKITAARGEKKISAEEVTQCCAQAGVPTLQSLNAMPHLIATVEANIDALLVMR